MKAYTGIFMKKDGSSRSMSFVKVKDLPEAFFDGKIKGTGKPRTLAEGSEMVYDLDAKGFRVFNHNTVVGNILEIELDDDLLVGQNNNTAVEEICSTDLKTNNKGY